MNKNLREQTISWLENNRNSGAFEGHPEDTMDFNKLDDDDIEWYHDNWVKEEQTPKYQIIYWQSGEDVVECNSQIAGICYSYPNAVVGCESLAANYHSAAVLNLEGVQSKSYEYMVYFSSMGNSEWYDRGFYCVYNQTREELYVMDVLDDVQVCMFPIEALEGHYLYDELVHKSFNPYTVEEELAQWAIDYASDFLSDSGLI